MNSPKGVKTGVPERVSISCPTCGIRNDLPQITWYQSYMYVRVSEQTIQHYMWHRGIKFVNKVCMTTIEFPKSSLMFPWRISLLQYLWNQNRSSEQKIFIFHTYPSITYQLWNKNTICRVFWNILLKYGNVTIRKSVITLAIELCEKFTILIKLQMKVKIINPSWNICSVFNLRLLGINNINIIFGLCDHQNMPSVHVCLVHVLLEFRKVDFVHE